MSALDKYNSADYQRAVGDMVNREVVYCVSSLISELAQNDGGDYWEDILSVCTQQTPNEESQALLDKLDQPLDYETEAYGIDIDKMGGVLIIRKPYDYGVFAEELGSLYLQPGDDGGALISALEALGDIITDKQQDTVISEYDHLLEDVDGEPETVEAHEHWIVSEWLAGKLKSKGEMVCRDIYGLTVWGRATTGQSISIDRVICDIFDESNQ